MSACSGFLVSPVSTGVSQCDEVALTGGVSVLPVEGCWVPGG